MLEDVICPAGSRFGHNLVGELFEDAIIAVVVSLGKIATSYVLAKAEMPGFRSMDLGRKDNIPETLAAGQLAEHQDCELVVTGKLLDILVAIVFSNQIVEIVAVKEV